MHFHFCSTDSVTGESCLCKEEIEKEEAIALAKALEVSSLDPPKPRIPGLTPTEREEVITIRIQPDVRILLKCILKFLPTNISVKLQILGFGCVILPVDKR